MVLSHYKDGGQHRNETQESWWKQTDDNPQTVWNNLCFEARPPLVNTTLQRLVKLELDKKLTIWRIFDKRMGIWVWENAAVNLRNGEFLSPFFIN